MSHRRPHSTRFVLQPRQRAAIDAAANLFPDSSPTDTANIVPSKHDFLLSVSKYLQLSASPHGFCTDELVSACIDAAIKELMQVAA